MSIFLSLSACGQGSSSEVAFTGTTAPPTTRPKYDVVSRSDSLPVLEYLMALTTTTTAPPPPTTQPPTSAPPAPEQPVEIGEAVVIERHTPAGSDDSVWYDLAQCESGGNWQINTGNGYYGGLQFSLSSWRAVGGEGYPHEASVATQIEMGKRLQEIQGWGAWPGCSRELGLR